MAEKSEAGTVFLPLTAQTERWRPTLRIARSASYDEVITKLRRMPQQVAENWDSYGGHAVPPAACERALTFITTLLAHLDEHPPAPEVGPVPEGGAVLRWRTEDHDIELTFLAKGGEYVVRERRSGDVVEEGEIGRPESLLRDVVKEYVTR
jgi:hypothetical protein